MPEPVRVAQVLTCDDVGGTESMVLAVAERLDQRLVDSHVLTLASPGPVARRLREAGLPVASLGGGASAGVYLRLAAVLYRGRFDVIVGYGFRTCAVLRLIRPLVARRAKLVRAIRGRHVSAQERTDTLKARVLLGLELLGAPLVDVYDANSAGAVRLLSDAGISAGKLRCIPNGIDVEAWPRHGEELEPPVIVCVARFVPVKRQADLALAAVRLREQGLPFQISFVGDGPTRAIVQRLVADWGLEDVISFEGALGIADVKRLLARAYAFCLPSGGEGMPGSVLEAMASELPVVGCKVNGVADLVVDGETGILVPAGDADALAAALGRLLRDPALARRLGETGRRRAQSQFGLDGMVAAKQDLYRSLAHSVP